VKEFSAQERGGAWKSGAIARAIGLSRACSWSPLSSGSLPATHRRRCGDLIPIRPNPGTVVHDCPTVPGMTVLPRVDQQGRRAPRAAGAVRKAAALVTIGRPLAMSTNAVTVDESPAIHRGYRADIARLRTRMTVSGSIGR